MNSERIKSLSQRLFYEPGAYIFQKGEERDRAYIIIKGEVEIITRSGGHEGVVSAVLGTGQIFGEMALMENGPRTASARAAQNTEVFAISRDVMHERMTGLDPIVGMLLSLLIDRYRKSRIFLPESIDLPESDEVVTRLKKMAREEEETESLSGHSLPNMIRSLDLQRQIAFEELDMEQKIRMGLEKNQFFPLFQPIVDLSTGRVKGFETLIRWEPEAGNVVSPLSFIPVAERTNMVQHLDFRMLRSACEDMNEFHKSAGALIPDFFLSVNLSGLHFDGTALVDAVSMLIKETRVEPKHIKLEITESALINDPVKAQGVLGQLKKLGVKIALDDFGTGYSSLGYLHKFPIDSIKIDRSFVHQIQTENRSVDIINAIIGLAKAFKMNVIAEGIEDAHDWNVLNNIGCGYGQGYYFGKPLPKKEALAFVKAKAAGRPTY